MWDMIFFFPNSQTTGDSHSANTTSHLPQTKIPPRANTTSHKQNHCVSFFAQIAVFFVWLSCVHAPPCRIAGSIPVMLFVVFCLRTSPCCVTCRACFPLLAAFCSRTSPCHVAHGARFPLLAAFCLRTYPCRVDSSAHFPLLLPVFGFACIPLSNNEHLNRGYNHCLGARTVSFIHTLSIWMIVSVIQTLSVLMKDLLWVGDGCHDSFLH